MRNTDESTHPVLARLVHDTRRWAKRVLPAMLCALLAVACATNPVTGERQLRLYGTEWEQQVGSQMYVPLKQAQGGEFVLDPELTQYVGNVGERLAAQAVRDEDLDFEFSILNNSTPNAWALPGGKIVINRGLLTELDSEAELAAVMAHEIVHADAAHGAHRQSTGVLAQAGAVAGMVILGSTIENQTARDLSMLVPQVGMQLIMQRYSREAEREADRYGMRYMAAAGYDPQGAVHLQETFVELSRDRRQDWLSGLFASHPPSMERVENNRKTARALPEGGEIGRQRYQRKLAFLERIQPAYEAYEEAGEALANNDLDGAQRHLDRALDIEPREALFISMQGDIHAKRNRERAAIRSFEQAIRANERLFYPYLRKGQMEYRTGDQRAARINLERSLELLPTAEAHYLLGRIDRESGNMESAVAHFQEAAKSQSDAGKRAQGELVRLDLQQNPERYIATSAAIDANARVWVQLANRTSVPMEDIELTYVWIDANGRRYQDTLFYRDILDGGESDRVRLNVSLPDAGPLENRFRVQVTAAQTAD